MQFIKNTVKQRKKSINQTFIWRICEQFITLKIAMWFRTVMAIKRTAMYLENQLSVNQLLVLANISKKASRYCRWKRVPKKLWLKFSVYTQTATIVLIRKNPKKLQLLCDKSGWRLFVAKSLVKWIEVAIFSKKTLLWLTLLFPTRQAVILLEQKVRPNFWNKSQKRMCLNTVIEMTIESSVRKSQNAIRLWLLST